MTFIKSSHKTDRVITLRKIDPPAPEVLFSEKPCINIAFLDVETTGLDRSKDTIIELAVKVVKLERETGLIVTIGNTYESFNDPGEEIDELITQITGITDTMVSGHIIDWDIVEQTLQMADLIVAHNAAFDRSFIDKYSTISREKVWACSIHDINWMNRGFTSAKQELLCYWHGFYFESHRAMNDVDALIHLLTHHAYDNDRPVLELIENANKSTYIIRALNFEYDPVKKDRVKANGYRWNANEKLWFKKVPYDDLETEKDWLTGIIYDTYFRGRVDEIKITDKYKQFG